MHWRLMRRTGLRQDGQDPVLCQTNIEMLWQDGQDKNGKIKTGISEMTNEMKFHTTISVANKYRKM